MNSNTRATETYRLVPHSGIQFITLGIDIDAAPTFSRKFVGQILPDRSVDEDTVAMKLQPGWNEDEPDKEPTYEPVYEDQQYSIAKDKAVLTFLNEWIPLPFLAVKPGLDQGREILDVGPLDWARMRISAAQPGDTYNGAPITHHVVIAFDTEISEFDQGRYVSPNKVNVLNEQEFALAHRFSDVLGFLSIGAVTLPLEKGLPRSWVDRWIFDAFVRSRETQLNKKMRAEDKRTLEHLARYVTLLQYLQQAVAIPRIRLVDTYSDNRRTKPVAVDLVLDVGNSRTCGILIESYPNDRSVSFRNTLVLALRNLSTPHVVYREPFESHVEFAEVDFGPSHYSHLIRTRRGFFWPSPVRVGPEASQFREIAEGSEGASGMSSPKRYLCDLTPVNQEWRFQPRDYDADSNPPLVARRLFQFVNSRGDVNREVEAEKKLYASLAASIGSHVDGGIPSGLTFSRSSIFTFMLAEVIMQAVSMMNNPEVRKERSDRDAPRELRRIILSLPTAMPIVEQRILRSRANAAVKLIWDMMGWTTNRPPNLVEWTVRVSWDEATCSQLVYLYNEIVEKFSANLPDFFDLTGRPRPFLDPERPKDVVKTDPTRSLRVASVDVGGGTTDLMIVTYHIQGDLALVPIQNFREGFRIAGDDALREVIQQTIFPALEAQLRAAGIASPREFLSDRFGSNKANMPIQQQQLRKLFLTRVLHPAGLGVLRLAEAIDIDSEDRIETTTLGALLRSASGSAPAIPDRIRKYIEEEAEKWGAAPFVLDDCPVTVNMPRIRAAIDAALGEVFDNIAEAINEFDCDVVLLSGRPTRLPATIDLFINKLAVSPDKVIPLSRYQVGPWYPFASRASFRIDDPKTATAVGCLLGVLVERQIPNFSVATERFNMRSTAKYIGTLQKAGKLSNNKVMFSWDDAANVEGKSLDYFAPIMIGYRQLPIERWTATPLYRLKLSASTARERIPRFPLTVTLGRTPPEESVSVHDASWLDEEARKEELTINEVEAADGGGGLKRLFSLTLETLPADDGYWLDTGILTVG
jgi:hypothetical protein